MCLKIKTTRSDILLLMQFKREPRIKDRRETFKGFKKINLELTNACNFNCYFCPTSVSKRKKTFLAYPLAKRIIREAAQDNLFNVISFTSLGEPLLHPRCLDIVKEAKSKGLITFLATNGSLLTKRVTKELIKVKPDFLVLGVNAGKPKEFKLRCSRLNFNVYIKRIKDALKVLNRVPGIHIILSYITTQGLAVDSALQMLPSENDKENIIRFWKNHIHVPIATDFYKQTKKSLNNKEKFVHFFFRKDATKISNNIYVRFKLLETSIIPSLTRKCLPPGKDSKGSCQNIKTDFTVLSDGTCTFCCQQDYNGEINLGNIKNSSLKGIYFGKKATILKYLNSKDILGSDFCRRCADIGKKCKHFKLNFFKEKVAVS